jgi:TetR/AcrR family transcriptional regulator, multidrug resistance operon repressor
MRNKDFNKELIIREKAIELIVNEGFDGLSMKKLAQAANLSPSTIYIYFQNREDLLNQLYIQVVEEFEREALQNFNAEMSFDEGLWLQWKNRLKTIVKNPLRYYFFEQFRNSPLVKHEAIKGSMFRETMTLFVENARKKGEILDLPLEVFWAISYGAFYVLVKFHLDKSSLAGSKFELNENLLRQTFDLVIKSLKP